MKISQPFRTLCGLMLGIFSTVPASWAEESSAGQDYLVKVWGADEGLTENSVTDVAETPEGYLWMGTVFGSVLRFDGTRFVSYNSANTPEFSFKWGIPRLMTDKSGTLWISMVDGGLTSWDKNGFRSAIANITQPERIVWSAPGKVTFVWNGQLLSGEKANGRWAWQTNALPDSASPAQHCADAEGRIWYLQNNNKVGFWAGKEIHRVSLPEKLAGQGLRALAGDNRGTIWLGTDQCLAMWQSNHFEIMTPTNGEAVLNIKRILPSGTSNLWVEANGRMRCCADRKWFAESDGWNRELSRRGAFRFLHGDHEGGLWTGIGDLGLIHVTPGGKYQRLTTTNGLPSNTIHFAYEDRDGDIWTGYERGGLVQVRRCLFHSIGRDEGLSDSLINTVCQDANGVVWIGTHSGVVGRYENGVCENLVFPGQGRVQDSCAVADANGAVWIGAQGIGLVKYENGQTNVIATPAQFQPSYPRLLLPARNGRLWVGTLWSVISVSNGVLVTNYSAPDVGGHPTALAEAADGTIWVGTLAGTLLHWDGKNFNPLEPPDRNSLGRIWALWAAPDGSLWAGTEEGGLLHWVDGKFFRYTRKQGLPSDSIVQVQGDAHGNLWLGTRAGITRILAAAPARFERGEMNELPVSVYGQSDGLLTIGSAIIYQPSCWRGNDGTLFFAMANSVAAVRPDQVHIDPTAPPVALEELRADDTYVWPENPGSILSISDSSAESAAPVIKIRPGRGDLEFHYTGVNLGAPQLVRFKYRLDNLESSWNDAGNERKAIYRHVPPGEYSFHVIACNSDGVFSADRTLLTVQISPHIYQTVWFRGGLAALVIVGVLFAVGGRMRRRMEQLERQHELERERTRIAQDLHDDLGAGLTEIGLLGGLLKDPSKLATRKTEALDRIVDRCHSLVSALDEIVWAINPRNDSVNSLASYLSRYAQNFLEPTAIRCRLEMSEADPDVALNSEQRHNLYLAFEEALTNVVRHSGATEANIKIFCRQEGRLHISIQDNGRGLPSAVPAGSEGLINLRARMENIGGKCEISAPETGGVLVRLTLPLAVARTGRQ